MTARDRIRQAAVALFRRLERWSRDQELRDLKARLGAIGVKTRIDLPSQFVNPQHVFLGARVVINPWCRIEAITGEESGLDAQFQPRLEIGDDVHIQSFTHIGCNHRVSIGNGCGIGGRVFISDHGHGFEKVDAPLREQPDRITEGAEVVIGEDCYIGEGVVILPGVHIGRHSVIAANSVVHRSLPELSVAGGNPARILKRYDPEQKKWVLRLG